MASEPGSAAATGGTAAYDRLLEDVFVYGNVSLALAVAQETGMIKILCQAEGPLSSIDVARQGKLKERYVRETLNTMAAAGVVELEAGTGGEDGVEARYLVPKAHRSSLQQTGIYSLAISAVGRRFAGVRSCFDLEGPNGLRYEENSFDVFDEWSASCVENTIAAILKTPGLRQRLEAGIKAMEVGAGLGTLSRHLAARFPNTHFTITDVVPKPLEHARRRAQEENLTNITFQLLDACRMPDDLKEKFDWVLTYDVVHDLPYPLVALKGISKALKAGGHFSMIDEFISSYVANNVGNRDAAVMYSESIFMCIPESYQQPDSEALGPGWGEEKARQLLKEAGLTVLGLTRSGTEDLGFLAVCMCEKPA